MIKNYRNYLFVILYLVLLRIVLNITTGLSMFNLGIVFDIILMMFWVGVIAFFFRSPRKQRVYYIFVMVLSTIFVVVDSVYHDYFNIITSKTSLTGIKFLAEGQTLESYSIKIPLVAYIVIPLLGYFIYLIIQHKERDVFRIKDFKYLSLIFVVQTGLFLYWGSYEFDNKMDYYRSDAYLFETMHDRVLFSEKYGYYNYHILDIVRFRVEPDLDDATHQVSDYFRGLDSHEPNIYSDQFEGFNVISLISESLDVRFIDETLTPNLYRMMTNGYTFENYYTPVFQQGATCNSEYMSLTGLNAITSNDWSNNICDAYNENIFPYSLPAQLRDNGYDTYYFHSGYEWFYNRVNMIPQYGFETVKFQEDLLELPRYIKDEEERISSGQVLFEDKYDTQMMYFVDEYVDFSNPFHITFLTYSMHGAYDQSELYDHEDRILEAYPNSMTEDHEELLDDEILSYMEKLVEFDNFIGELLERLETEGVLDETLIAIYPDHYLYMMNYRTYTEHLEIDTEEHNYNLYKQKLILYTPSMTPRAFSVAGSTIDITPTILNLVYSDANFDYFMGTDLLSTNENYVMFSDLTITDGVSFLTLSQKEYGEPFDKSKFEDALKNEIEAFDIQKLLLNTDYFRQISED